MPPLFSRPAGLCLAVLLGLAPFVTTPAAAQSQAAEPMRFDIPAQPLDQAVTELARQAGLAVGGDAALLRGKQAPALAGEYTPRQALDRLLAGSGTAARFTGDNTVTLAAAGNGNGPAQLGPITVLGSRQVDAPLSNVPASITLVERERIEQELATSTRTEDLLRRTVPGFNPTNNGVRQIRGRTAQVFINGVPVNEQLRNSSGNDVNLLRPEQLADIEVARGANSAFGFGSPGGIVALSTPRADSDELTLRTRVSESFNPQQFGGSHQSVLYQSASQIMDAFDFHVGGAIAYDGAEFDSDGDLAAGTDNSALLGNGKEWIGSLDANLGYDLGDGGRVRLAATFNHVDFRERFDIDNVEGFPANKEQFDRLVEQPRGDDAFRTAYTLNLSYENTVLDSPFKIEALTSDTEAEFFAPDFADPDRITRDEMENQFYGVRSSVTTPLDTLAKAVPAGSTVTYGIDFMRNELSRRRVFTDTGETQTQFAPPVTLDTYALHVQLQIPIGDRVDLTTGVRQEFYDGEVEPADQTFSASGGIEGGDIDSFDLSLWNAGVVYHANPNLEAFFSFSQGAEITELGRAAFEAVSADQIDLQPAESDQFELGLRGSWSSLSFSVTGFFTESDLLNASDCSDPDIPCQPLREPRELYGIELAGEWQINRQVAAGTTLSWLEGTRDPQGKSEQDIGGREVPPVLIAPYIEYRPSPGWRNRLQLDYRAARGSVGSGEAFGEGAVPDRMLVNLSSALELGGGTLTVGIENLLNNDDPSIVAEANNGFGFLPDEGTRLTVSYQKEF